MSDLPQPEKDPDQIVLEFLDALPATIREPVLFKCCFGVEASGFVEFAIEDKITILERYLHDARGSRSYRCAQLIGVVEVVLEPPASTAERPLWERHLAAARETFAELRRTLLHPSVLARWQDALSAERPWIEDAQ